MADLTLLESEYFRHQRLKFSKSNDENNVTITEYPLYQSTTIEFKTNSLQEVTSMVASIELKHQDEFHCRRKLFVKKKYHLERKKPEYDVEEKQNEDYDVGMDMNLNFTSSPSQAFINFSDNESIGYDLTSFM